MISDDMKKHIDEVVDELDFDRIRDTMKALNWVWVKSESSDHIPSTKELRKAVTELALESYVKYTPAVGLAYPFNAHRSTGGFVVGWEFVDADAAPYLSVSFVLSEANSGYV